MHGCRQANTCPDTKAQTEQDIETLLEEHPHPAVWAHNFAKSPVCEKQVRDGEGFPPVGKSCTIWLQWGWEVSSGRTSSHA